MYENLTDDQLLRKLDSHPVALDTVGCEMLESMMKQRARKNGRPLSEKQRVWVIGMLKFLDKQKSAKFGDADEGDLDW